MSASVVASPPFELARQHSKNSAKNGDIWRIIKAPLTGSATKDYDRATDAHFRPDKPWGATGKLLIVLNPWLTLNQRVPGSSPGAPTKQIKT